MKDGKDLVKFQCDIIQALGFKTENVQKFVMVLEAEKWPTVEITFAIHDHNAEKFESMTKRYKLKIEDCE